MPTFDPNEPLQLEWIVGEPPASDGTVIEYDVIEVYSQLQRGAQSARTTKSTWHRRKPVG